MISAQPILTDYNGNSTGPISGNTQTQEQVPGVTVLSLGPDSIIFIVPVTGIFTVTFNAPGTPFNIAQRSGTGNSTSSRVKYADQNPTAGQLVVIAMTNGGGAPTVTTGGTTVPPTSNVTGAAASDTTAPVLNLTAKAGIATIGATDAKGVSTIRFSLDGTTYQTYNGPFTVSGVVTVRAFTDDTAGNRSGLSTLVISGPSRIGIPAFSTGAKLGG